MDARAAIAVALNNVLHSEKWRDRSGLSEDTMYGELAIDVALAAVSAEREACAKIVDPPKDVAISSEARMARMVRQMLAEAIRNRGE